MNKLRIMSTISGLVSRLTPGLAKELLNDILNFIEDKVGRTRNPFDDMIIMPIIKIIRRILSIIEIED